ncbi:MAG: hypothetical protein KA802_09300 [Saprospiraceae bacterium]|nr:hypothetical protein [Saprospiraceae bacterium]
MTRPSWEQHWMEEAYRAAEMTTCCSRGVGAVIVSEDNRQLSKRV